jgi:hypothetical protein
LINANEEIYVLNSTFAIIEKFISDYHPDIIFYKALGTRKRIYDRMFNKINLSDYTKEDGVMNTFLIKKEIIK